MTAGHRVAASAAQSAGDSEIREDSALPKTYLALNNPLRSGQGVEVCADYLRGRSFGARGFMRLGRAPMGLALPKTLPARTQLLDVGRLALVT